MESGVIILPLELVINLQPITKKNHGQIVHMGKRHVLLPSKPYLQYEKDCGVYLHQYFGLKINVPVNFKAIYYVKDKGVKDLVGLHQSLQDILVKYEVLKDDDYKIIASHDGSKVIYDKENPRTELTITRIKQED